MEFIYQKIKIKTICLEITSKAMSANDMLLRLKMSPRCIKLDIKIAFCCVMPLANQNQKVLYGGKRKTQ